jgi:phosphatidylserine/phosphatidylglycerophosphate/cardiolipin synthase-like enzyme
MLNPARRGGEAENQATRATLAAADVDVLDSNPAFDLTHEKSLVVDDEVAFVQSLNWEPRDLTDTRDFAIATDDPHEVQEIVDCFEADWSRQTFAPGGRASLVWCNNNGRTRIAEFIDGAKRSITLQNERYQDPVIIERLVRAARRGVKVHVMARPPHTLKKDKLLEGVSGLRLLDDVGAKVHKLKHLKLHAKMLLADDCCAMIGSINLAPGSFDARRELAIEVSDKHLLNRLQEVVAHDWEHSHRLDLTDAGLLADLEKRGGTVDAGLALKRDAPKKEAAAPD